MRAYLRLSLLAVSLLPLACGSDDPQTNAQQGVFVDSPVEGLSFQTASQSGTTDTGGTFQFLPGETVRFFLGDLELGQASVQDTLSPFDLAGIQALNDGASVNRFYENDLSQSRVTPFDRVLNMAIFLQSLDEDNDLENGIKIPTEIPGLLAGTSLSFDRKFSTFRSEVGLLNLRRQGFDQGLWGGGRPLPSQGRALDHLYASLGLTPEISRHLESLNHTEGQPDVRSRSFYDAEGRLASLETDLGNDGALDFVFDLFYDENDQVVRFESDNLNDALPKSVGVTEFDAEGKFIRSTTDTNDDGVAESTTKGFHDELGRLIRTETDGPDAGDELDSINLSFFDDQGNLIRSENDQDANGSPDSITVSTFDSSRRRIRSEFDSDGDGSPDNITENEYDAQGNLTVQRQDNDGDNIFENVTTHEFDENGNLIRTFRDNPDPSSDSVTINQYDALGNLIESSQDTDNDGTANSILKIFYDEKGNIVRAESDSNADGTPETVIHTQHEPGNFLSLFTSEIG